MVSLGTGNSGFDKCQQWPVILATSHKDFHIHSLSPFSLLL